MSRGKIQKPLLPQVTRFVMMPDLDKTLPAVYQHYIDINKAHVIMLERQGIISQSTARRILKANQELSDMGDVPTFPINPDLEDIYFNLEKYVIDRIGMQDGGQQHTARSRNDLFATADRMCARAGCLRCAQALLTLRETLLTLARENTQTVFAGYTHLQPSEPITFAHYCSALLQALERDSARINALYARININPLGAGSMGSTSFAIDRELTTQLLGFDRVMQNSLDAIAASDYVQELAATLAIAATTLGRSATDLYTWATPDYGYVEVDDSVAVCSSIMPQKKNPLSLEYTRAQSGKLQGMLMSVMAMAKNTPYTLSIDNNVCLPQMIGPLLEDFTRTVELFNATLTTLKVNPQKMKSRAADNFCSVTELANTLVRYESIAFRQAHEIVAELVNVMLEKGLGASRIDAPTLHPIFKRHTGSECTLSSEQIQAAIDPSRIAQAKRAQGGTAPDEVLRQLSLGEQAIKKDRDILLQRESRLAKAHEILTELTEGYIH